MSALPLADFFDSEAWFVTRNLLFFFVIVFWLAVGYWTYKDARRRIQDPWLVAMATLLGLVPPFVGALIYMLFRPPEYLDEVRERELEMKALQALRPSEERCPVCRSAVETGYLVCPVCTTRLRESCSGCKAPLDPLVAGLPVLRDACLAPGAGRGAGHGVRSRRAGEGAAAASSSRVDFSAMERTLILVKPDAMERGLAGEILGRFERRGLVVRAARLLTVDRELAEQHYAEHAEKPFFGELVGFITTGSTLALVLEGEDAVSVTRTTIGATNPVDAAPGHDPRRPRARDAEQPRARLGLARDRRARDRALVRR